MANRYPLVVDTSDNNQIKEIPNGDNLLLTGNSITGVVDITASGNISAAGVVMSGTLTYQGNPLANIATTAAYSDLTGVPTNVSQFTNDANYRSNGDNVSVFTNDAGYLTTVSFNDLTGKPTTLGGYGIIDAASSVQGSLATSALQPGANISTLNNDSGFVTLTQLTDGTVTVDVNNSGDLVGSVFADDSTMMVDSILAAVNLDGTIRGNVVPNANQHNTWDLGTDAVRFKNAYFAGTINGAHVGTLDGDVEGSVFGDDSTLLVDGVNNKIVGVVETSSLRTSEFKIALGYEAGKTNQGNTTVAIGFEAGKENQDTGAVAIGDSAGESGQGTSSVAVGLTAGQTNQSMYSTAVGYQAGKTTQGQYSVAIGNEAGETTQGAQSIAIGDKAGQTTQGDVAVAIGTQAGMTTQGLRAIAIGLQAAEITQANDAVAIGNGAGYNNQGQSAIAIGAVAGNVNQAARSIVISAAGVAVNNTTADSLVITPIRSAVGTTMLMYDATTGEVTHTASPVITGDLTGSVFGDDSTLLVDGVNNKIVGDIETSNLFTNGFTVEEAYSATPTTKFFEVETGAGSTRFMRTGINMSGFGTSVAPSIQLTSYRSSPADNNAGPEIVFRASTDGSQNKVIGEISSLVYSKASGAETGEIHITTVVGGSNQGVEFRGRQIKGSGGSLLIDDDLTITGHTTFDKGVEEKFATTNGATGVTALDCATGNVHYLTAPAGDITANFTNLNLTAEYATNVTVVIDQGATEYEITAVQIGGVAQTIVWQGNSAPTGTANGVDSFSFTILNDGGTYVVLGQMVPFGGV